MKQSIFFNAFKTSLPALCCYFPLGLIYGVLCTQAGYSWYYAPLFSTFVLAGAMQFLALSLLAVGAPFLTIALAIIPLGIRNIFYGLTMLERYHSARPLLKLYLAHGLVDATYSLLHTGPTISKDNDMRYITALTVLNHAYWVLGSLMGSFIIRFTTVPPGLEFAMTAFFAATAVEQFLKKKQIKPLVIASCSILIAAYICPHHFFLAAIAIAILTSLALPLKERRVA